MLYAIVAVIVLILDQATKYWANVNLTEGAASKLIPGVFHLTRVHNPGAAFSLFSDGDARWFFVALAVVVSIAIVVVLSRGIVKGALGRWSLVFIIAGALGNAIDRAINGYVVDMFHFPFELPLIKQEFPVFNVADIFITVFGIVFCIYVLLHKEPEAEETPARPAPRPMPRTTEPVVRTDYITQLKKPVVEGKKNIEREIRLKTAEASLSKSTDSVVTDWSDPFADITPPPPIPAAKPRTPTEPAPVEPHPHAPAAQPESLRRPASAPAASFEGSPLFEELKNNPVIVPPSPAKATAKAPTAPAPKKSDGSFNLDDIIAEFKD